ncbi:ArsR family transcriptional regulator [Micromonosporaceae bacterium Da 78-11]
MYEETGLDGRRVHTVAQIAAEFGVTRPTIYRHLAGLPTQAQAQAQATSRLKSATASSDVPRGSIRPHR